MRIMGPRRLARQVAEALRCSRCGKLRTVQVTRWSSRASGSRDREHVDPVARERVSPETHCACPGGPAQGMEV